MSKAVEFCKTECNNEDAAEFLQLWENKTQLAKDVIDNSEWNPESILGCLYAACKVYSHPFYRHNWAWLQVPSILSANSFKKSGQYGDQMESAVVLIAGGYDSLCQYSSNEQ